MDRSLSKTRENQAKSEYIDFLVTFCILCRFGFPGNLAILFGGERISFAISYICSALQIVLILLASGDSIEDIRLIDLKKKYLPVYCMLLIMSLTSLMVSGNRIKQTTIIIRFSITVFFGLWLADKYEVEHLLEIVYLALVGVVVANLLARFVFPRAGYHVDENYGYIFRGLYSQKNSVGTVFAWGILLQFELFRIKRRNNRSVSRAFWLVMCFQFFFLFTSKATTALFSGSFTLLYLLLYNRIGKKEFRLQWGIVFAVVSVGFLFFALTVMPIFKPFLEAIGKDASLTGRIPMWEKIIAFMQESHTFTGYGLLQFWETPDALTSLQGMFERHSWYSRMENGAHNLLLETWLDVGLIGVASYLVTVILCFRNYKTITKDRYELCSIVILMILICGLTDRIYSNVYYETLFTFVMLGLACSSADAPVNRRLNRELLSK